MRITKNVALYARVSKDEKFEDSRFQDPENQLIQLREYCKSHNWNIVKEYIDKASGADPNREQFRLMFKEVYKYDAIVVWKLDRFSREPLFVVLSYLQMLRNSGTGIISMTENWLDTRQENPFSELVLAVMAWASSEERRKISERTKAGIARRRAIGQWKGGRPRKK